jgi:hypothetical protein
MRKYTRMVMRVDAIILPTIAIAVCVAVMAVVWEAETCWLACEIWLAAAAYRNRSQMKIWERYG